MAKFQFAVQTDTVEELYSSVAEFLSLSPNHAVQVRVTDTGGLVAHVAPGNAPAGMVPGPQQPTTTAPIPTAPLIVPGPQQPTTTTAAEPTGDADGPANANPPAYDAAGIPWDERIHAGTKGMNQDGTWKRRRNTADVTYNIVMAELQSKTAGQAPSTPPAPPVPASPGIVDQGPIPVPPPVVVPAPPMVAAPVVPAAPIPPAPAMPAEQPAAPAPVAVPAETVAPPAASGMPFNVFMPKIAAAMGAQKFDSNYLTSCLKQWELTDVSQLQADPVKTQAFYEWMKAAGLMD